MNQIEELLKRVLTSLLVDMVISGARGGGEFLKIKIRPVVIRDILYFQVSKYTDKQVFHENLTAEEAAQSAAGWIMNDFRQAQIRTQDEMVTVLASKKGKLTIKTRKMVCAGPQNLEHNRKKKYIIEEGTKVPFMVDLGVMTESGKIVRTRYDKYRQINRFLEFIEDILPQLARDREITILDFGCGKSYLTFAMYYYLRQIKGYDVNIIGLDLKTDVIEKCNKLAEKYGYEKLHFYQGDIAEYEGVSSVDMVVTLHACDTATDYALAKAVQWGAGVILSVPCCQHEVNRQIKNEMLEPVLRYGILKERISALITDGVRANLLESRGYETQLLEFIDMEHTPKNLLIRAVKTQKSAGNPKVSAKNKTERMMKELEIHPTLDRLLEIIEEGEMI